MKRRHWAVLLGIVVVLLALGALPSLLKSGDPYHVAATPVDGDREAVNASELSADQYRYVTEALESNRSDRYWKGPVGVKGAFTHSPFDEFEAIEQQHPTAVDGDAVYVRRGGSIYRLEIIQES